MGCRRHAIYGMVAAQPIAYFPEMEHPVRSEGTFA
jgi:hypothetical protein